MIQENGEKVRQKCKILLPCLASAIRLVAFVAGGFTVNAQSVELQAPDPTKEMSDRIPEKAPTSSWNRPVFTGNPGNKGIWDRPTCPWTAGYIRLSIA